MTGLAERTRDASTLVAALADAGQTDLRKQCSRVVRELQQTEEVVEIAASDSGGRGVLALTTARVLFVTPKTVYRQPIAELEWAYAEAPDYLKIHKAGAENHIGFRDVNPTIADRFADLLWSHGVKQPEGLIHEAPSTLLPARDAEVLFKALDPVDQPIYRDYCLQLSAVLEPSEEVVVLASCVSGTQRMLALTDRRLLSVGHSVDGRSILVSLVPFTALMFTRANSASSLTLGLNSTNWPRSTAFTDMKPAIAKAFVDRLSAMGVGDPQAALADRSSSGPDQSALGALPSKTLKVVRPHIAPSEEVFFCLVGEYGQAVIALSDRLLIAKAGLMSGNMFGGKVNSFPYREITGIQVHTGLSTAVLVVETPSFRGTQAGSYWSQGKDSPKELPNAIPIASKRRVTQWQPQLDLLRSAIASGGLVRKPREATSSPGQPVFIGPVTLPDQSAKPSPEQASQPSSSAGLADEIQKLAALRDANVLSEEEFAAAKAKLLG